MTITYGCDCDCGCHPQGAKRAPVAFLIERKGREMKVCTRCDLSTDKKLARLFDAESDFLPFFDFDPLAIVLAQYCDDEFWNEKTGVKA